MFSGTQTVAGHSQAYLAVRQREVWIEKRCECQRKSVFAVITAESNKKRKINFVYEKNDSLNCASGWPGPLPSDIHEHQFQSPSNINKKNCQPNKLSDGNSTRTVWIPTWTRKTSGISQYLILNGVTIMPLPEIAERWPPPKSIVTPLTLATMILSVVTFWTLQPIPAAFHCRHVRSVAAGSLQGRTLCTDRPRTTRRHLVDTLRPSWTTIWQHSFMG